MFLSKRANTQEAEHGALPSFVYKDKVKCFTCYAANLAKSGQIEEVKDNSTISREAKLNMEPNDSDSTTELRRRWREPLCGSHCSPAMHLCSSAWWGHGKEAKRCSLIWVDEQQRYMQAGSYSCKHPTLDSIYLIKQLWHAAVYPSFE